MEGGFPSEQFFTPETSRTDLQSDPADEGACWSPHDMNKFSTQTLHNAAKARATIGK